MDGAGHTLTHKAAPRQDNPTSTVSGWWLISGGDKPSLWCQELLCPPWAWEGAALAAPSNLLALSLPRNRGLFGSTHPLDIPFGWKGAGGAGGSSVASQGILEVGFLTGFLTVVSPQVLLIAGWALGQDSDVQVLTSQGCVVLLMPATP